MPSISKGHRRALSAFAHSPLPRQIGFKIVRGDLVSFLACFTVLLCSHERMTTPMHPLCFCVADDVDNRTCTVSIHFEQRLPTAMQHVGHSSVHSCKLRHSPDLWLRYLSFPSEIANFFGSTTCFLLVCVLQRCAVATDVLRTKRSHLDFFCRAILYSGPNMLGKISGI